MSFTGQPAHAPVNKHACTQPASAPLLSYPSRRVQAIAFIDDLNMPQLDRYGAQPPIELLRQAMDHGGWYDRHDNSFRKLVDIQVRW